MTVCRKTSFGCSSPKISSQATGLPSHIMARTVSTSP